MNNILNEFELKIGLSLNIIPGTEEELKKYLTMDISILEKLTYETCANITYRLAQYALYIQRCLNRQNALEKDLIHKIDNIIAPRISQYSGNWTMQRVAAILDNDVSRELDSQLNITRQRIENLQFVANGIKELANNMKNIQFTKKDHNV